MRRGAKYTYLDSAETAVTPVDWLQAAAVEATRLPSPPGLGEREAAYRDLFWRPVWRARGGSALAVSVYGSLAAAAAGGVALSAGLLQLSAGSANRRGLGPALDWLETQGLARVWRRGRSRVMAYHFEVLTPLPPLTPAEVTAAGWPRPMVALHLDFLGLTPGFDLPAWWRREEPSFLPAAARLWGFARLGG